MDSIVRYPARIEEGSLPRVRATVIGELVAVSGQLPVDRATGGLVGLDDIGAQTIQTLRNLEAVLKEAGSGLMQVLRTTVYITDASLAAGMNEAYGQVFGRECPARTTVVAGLTMAGALVEIDALGVRSDA